MGRGGYNGPNQSAGSQNPPVNRGRGGYNDVFDKDEEA